MSTVETPGPEGTARGSWDELVSAALIGTERRTFVRDPAVAAGAQDADPPRALLQQAMLAAIPILTGPQPTPYEGPLPEPAPGDDRPLISRAAQVRLRALLDGRPKDLAEWLTAVRAAGRRLPPSAMPGLLDAGRSDALISAALAEALGEYGRWLAPQNSSWRYLLRESVGPLRPEDWDGPDPDARIAYANGLYAADPAAARALLQTAWPTLTAAVKVHLLDLVARHGTTADLPFAEGVLRDSSKQVREGVPGLMSQLQRRDEEIRKRLSPEQFVADVEELARSENISREIHRFAMQRTLERWPVEGARAVLVMLVDLSRDAASDAADPSGEHAAERSGLRERQAAELLLRVLTDCAPTELYPDAERAVQARNEDTAAGIVHHLDFVPLLAALGFRAEMLAELTASDDAAPGQD